MDQKIKTENAGGETTNSSNNSSKGVDDKPTRHRHRNKANNSNGGGGSHPKFTGLDQDDMKGIVIDLSIDHKTPLSLQFDAFYKAAKIAAGKLNSKLNKPMRDLVKLTEEDYEADMPNSSAWTTQVGEKTIVDEFKKEMKTKLWLDKVKEKRQAYSKYEEDLKQMFSTLYGQLSPGVTDKLKALPEWGTIEDEDNTLELIKKLREICYRDNETTVCPALDVFLKLKKWVEGYQDSNKDATTYVEESVLRFEVLKSAGITIHSKELIKYALKKSHSGTSYDEYTKMSKDGKDKIRESAGKILQSIQIVEGANRKNHRNIQGTLRDEFCLKQDAYPTSPGEALELINRFKTSRSGTDRADRKTNHGQPNGKRGQDDKNTQATAFVTNGEVNKPKLKKATQLFMNAIANGENFGDELCFVHMCKTERAGHTPSGTLKSECEKPRSECEKPRSECEKPRSEHAMSNGVEQLFAQTDGKVDPYLLLLDSQATCNVIANPAMLKNIRRHPEQECVIIHCNAGSVATEMVGDLPGFGMVWYLETGIANVLSLGLVSDQHRVTLDTSVDQAFFVHKNDGTTRRFCRADNNLYVSDLREQSGAVFAITTTEGQKQLYSDLDVRRAERAHKLQEVMGFPSKREFLKLLDSNRIQNCSVTRRDVQIADDIYGPNANIIKGKTVRRQPVHTRAEVAPVPHAILQRYKNITLSIDVYTVNGVRFLRTVSHHLRFRTSRAIYDAKKSTLLSCITAVIGLYASREFQVVMIFGDGQFECLREDLLQHTPPVHLDVVAPGSHDPTIERDNRTSKERCRCTFAAIPFRRLPTRMIIELVNGVDYWLNHTLCAGGVSATLSPREIMTGEKLDAAKHCQFQFGDYVLAHGDDTNNTMEPRAVDAIYLRPSSNRHGGMFLFDLHTARRIYRQSATLGRLSQAIISRVEQIASEQQAPTGLLFGDKDNNTTILDLETTSVASDDDASDGSFQPDDASVDTVLTGVTTESFSGTDATRVPPVDTDASPDEASPGTADATPAGAATSTAEPPAATPIPNAASETPPADAPKDDAPAESDSHPDGGDAPEGRYNLRPSVRCTHNKFSDEDGFATETHHRTFFTAGYRAAVKALEREHNGFMLVAAALEQYNNLDASLVTKQYGVKKGLELFGDKGVEAILSELQQMHDMEVVAPVHPKDMTKEEVQRSLQYLMFLKRKRCGKIKARGCADGRPQREFISKEDASSPTVSLYALMLSCLIDAIEGRDVATADIPGAFLQTPMPEDENVHIRLDGTMAELFAQLDPQNYNKILVNRNGRKVMFAKAKRAIYGTLRAAILFWEKLVKWLKGQGFEANPYDMCTMNKMVNGNQLTIVWHVDDLKISHKDSAVVDQLLVDLNQEFGKIKPLSVTRGKVHEYVGMTIDYSETGKVKFSMFDYIADILSDLPESLDESKTAATPAASHLFDVSDKETKLNETEKDIFHSYVAKLLFVAKRARPDIQTAIAFLCTRVQDPDVHDQRKLKRVLNYLRDSIFLPLVLGWDGTGNTYWYVDASFAVHADMRSHTGGMMTMGQGAVLSVSTKQKINTKSSTEAEVVGVDDVLPFNVLCYYFLQWQGYHAKGCNPQDGDNPAEPVLGENNILYQDNTSAIKLETNGKASSTKRTRHINIRYFLITDKVKKGEVSIEYCPTGDMIADVFTKPLQGSLFRKFRNQILGINEQEYLAYEKAFKKAKDARTTDHK